MKIAVTYEEGNVFQHFGQTSKFKIYEISEAKVTKSEIVDTQGSGHGALAEFLRGLNITIVICGGIGAGAKDALENAGIELYGGVTGECDKVVDDYLRGRLEFDGDVSCSHHDHEHSEGHTCGSHGCH